MHSSTAFATTGPVILNALEDTVTRPDLADRAILLMLAPIAEHQRPLGCLRYW